MNLCRAEYDEIARIVSNHGGRSNLPNTRRKIEVNVRRAQQANVIRFSHRGCVVFQCDSVSGRSNIGKEVFAVFNPFSVSLKDNDYSRNEMLTRALPDYDRRAYDR